MLMAIFHLSSLQELVLIRVAFFSPITFNLVTETVLFSYENRIIGICSDTNLYDLEHADDVLLPFEDSSKSQIFQIVWTSVGVFGMHSAPLEHKMLLHNWTEP